MRGEDAEYFILFYWGATLWRACGKALLGGVLNFPIFSLSVSSFTSLLHTQITIYAMMSIYYIFFFDYSAALESGRCCVNPSGRRLFE